jgi:hypothetical protein
MPQAGFATSQLEEGREAGDRRPSRPIADAPGASLPGHRTAAGVPGRRTVTITGRGAERYQPPVRRRPPRTAQERISVRPDRTAMWAVLLGVLLILVAATSAHAATAPAQKPPAAHHLTVARPAHTLSVLFASR